MVLDPLFLVPEYTTDNVEFSTEYIGSGVRVYTNIDFIKLNELYHRRISKKHLSVSPVSIFSHLLEVEYDLFFSSTYLSEIATNSMHSNLIQQRLSYLINKSSNSKQQLNNFQEKIFQGKSIREAMNKKIVNLDDLVTVLKKSLTFKKWLAYTQPNENLIDKYFAEVTNGSFFNKLPCKIVRFILFVGLGLAGDYFLSTDVLVTFGLSAIDSLILDKLIRGWKPNQFVGEVKKIII